MRFSSISHWWPLPLKGRDHPSRRRSRQYGSWAPPVSVDFNKRMRQIAAHTGRRSFVSIGAVWEQSVVQCGFPRIWFLGRVADWVTVFYWPVLTWASQEQAASRRMRYRGNVKGWESINTQSLSIRPFPSATFPLFGCNNTTWAIARAILFAWD